MNKLFLGFIFLISLGGCSKYEVVYGVADEDQEEEYEIVYTDDFDIFLTDRTLTTAKRVTNTSTLERKVVISHNHQKIAYLDLSDVPVIINTDGEVLERLTNYAGADHFNWSADDETLYILKDNQLYFYGENMDLSIQKFSKNEPDVSNYKAEMAVVSENGDVAYFAKYILAEEEITPYSQWDSQQQIYVITYDTTTVYNKNWELIIDYKDNNLSDNRHTNYYNGAVPYLVYMRFREGTDLLYYSIVTNGYYYYIQPSNSKYGNSFYSPSGYPYFAGVNKSGDYSLFVGNEGLTLYNPKTSVQSFYKTSISPHSEYYDVNADWK